MSQEAFLARIGERLEQAGIPFMVAGSYGSSFHGQPRATNDVDFVIDPSAQQLEAFLSVLGDKYYVSAESAREALRNRSMFNIIDFAGGWKADLIVRKDRPFSVLELQRRQAGTLHGRSMPIATAEDIILSKLEWNKITPSERQVKDALNVAVVQWAKLDRTYLRAWAPALDIAEDLEKLLRAAEGLQPAPGPQATS
jgi:hypothetical protein